MTTAITNATPWDATPVEPTQSAHGKRRTSKTAQATDSVLNAFAATLAAVLGPAQLIVPTPDADGADSELDASPDGATAKNGAVAGVASKDASPKGSTGTGARDSRVTNTRGTDVRSTDARTVDTRTTDTRTTETRTTPTRTAAAIDVTLPAAVPDPTAPAPVAVEVAPVPQLSELVAATTLPTAPAVADRPAFAAAAEARAAAKTAPVTNVNADSDALNPEFRTRLGRVVTRMREEYGHDVELVEGFRPQSRQDFLYEQGRTRPGAVVTWTRSSKHTLGLAADLKIDGSYDNTAAYQQLARIAQQEGLRTLGTRDPGHVELPSRGGAAAWGAPAETARIDEGVSRAVGLALAADTTSAADATSSDTDAINGLLSRVNAARAAVGPHATASFAGMQSGLGGGMAGGHGGHDMPRQQAAPQGVHPGAPTEQAAPSRTSDVAQVAGVARVADVAQVAQVASVAQVAQVAAAGAAVATHGVPVHATASAPSAPLPSNGAASAERVGHLLDVRDATPAQPLSHVTLNLDNANGGTDRITVQLRGGAVDTSIALGDTSRADRMSLRVGELQHALEQHGLETGAIRVAQTGTNNSAGWTPRQGGDQGSADQRPAPNHRDHRQDADDARQRSRREQHGGKQQ